MRYTVIERSSLEQLAEQVNELINQGWLPTGGVAASVVQIQNREDGWDNLVYYAQALTHKDLPNFK